MKGGFYLIFSIINRKLTLAPMPPDVNLGSTLGITDINYEITS